MSLREEFKIYQSYMAEHLVSLYKNIDTLHKNQDWLKDQLDFLYQVVDGIQVVQSASEKSVDMLVDIFIRKGEK